MALSDSLPRPYYTKVGLTETSLSFRAERRNPVFCASLDCFAIVLIER